MKHPSVVETYQEARRLIAKTRLFRDAGDHRKAKIFWRMARHEWQFARRLTRMVRGLPR